MSTTNAPMMQNPQHDATESKQCSATTFNKLTNQMKLEKLVLIAEMTRDYAKEEDKIS